MFPLPLLWKAFFSGGGRLSRQMLQCLKTFSSSLLSGIMGLRSKLTQLTLVGNTFLSNNIPIQKTKTTLVTAKLCVRGVLPGFFILPVYWCLSTYSSVNALCIVLNEHDVKTLSSFHTTNGSTPNNLTLGLQKFTLQLISLQHMLRSLVGLRSSEDKNNEHYVEGFLTLQRWAEITIKHVLNIVLLYPSSANYTFLSCLTQKNIFFFTLGIISVFSDFEQNCSCHANRWEELFERKDWQFSCSYRDWHRAPTHPAAFQQLVWKMMRRSVPTIPHTDSCWDCGPHSAARQLNCTKEMVRIWKKCLHL